MPSHPHSAHTQVEEAMREEDVVGAATVEVAAMVVVAAVVTLVVAAEVAVETLVAVVAAGVVAGVVAPQEETWPWVSVDEWIAD